MKLPDGVPERAYQGCQSVPEVGHVENPEQQNQTKEGSCIDLFALGNLALLAEILPPFRCRVFCAFSPGWGFFGHDLLLRLIRLEVDSLVAGSLKDCRLSLLLEILKHDEDAFTERVKFPSQEAGDHTESQSNDNKRDADIQREGEEKDIELGKDPGQDAQDQP